MALSLPSASEPAARPVRKRPLTSPPLREATAHSLAIVRVLDRLQQFYGQPEAREPSDLLEQLVSTILSQHTSDLNTARAYAALLAEFRTFEAVLHAPAARIEASIRSGGLAHIKAARIKRVLQQIQADRGELRLDFLADLTLKEAQEYLVRLDGVGPKTAACVLLFACNRPAIPVDTHIHRVSRRLGLVSYHPNANQAQLDLETIVPPERAYACHVQLIRLGREICTARRAHCERCPLDDLCPRRGVRPAG